jgi:hypothetical protein
MYLSIGAIVADMEDDYGTASVERRLERIARQEPLATRAAGFLRRTAQALLATAATLDDQRGSAVGHSLQTAA